MYADQLDEATLDFEQIFLDPNNPRFWTEKGIRDIPDPKIPDPSVQAKTHDKIASFGISELHDSMLRNGFLPLDRIVVRPIEGHSDKFVIVEGNRRFAALTVLRQEIEDATVNEEDIHDDQLQKLLKDTNRLVVLIYQGLEAHDISWLLQGIRHISGIRPWAPAQRARLVAEQIDQKGLGFKSAGQTFGLSAHRVGSLYRSFKALDQMRQDDEFSAKAKNEYFTLFEETIRNKAVREWLDWSNSTWRFENDSNLKQFYSWISEDEENNNSRRIHDPRHIKDLGYLISGGHKTLLSQVDQYDITITDAYSSVKGMAAAKDWKAKIEQARKLIADLPQEPMFEETEDFLNEITKLETQIALRKTAIAAVLQSLT